MKKTESRTRASLPSARAPKSKKSKQSKARPKTVDADMIVLKVDMLVKPGTEDRCREYIRILQEHSRKEPGCLMYIGHQAAEEPRRFLFYEQYKDEAALQAHRDSPHFQQHVIRGLDKIMEQRTRDLYRLVE